MIVAISAPGGRVYVDATASYANGLLDLDEDHSNTELHAAVVKAVARGDSLISEKGGRVLAYGGIVTETLL